ncbi:hypothetical protein [Streptantibioticus silvisoli]|uniref:Uncharacterized protein n=1 Tax=Streptantibioticus silvisoli TaxID=2705255 RepID=A0ABT6W2K4_9ACTN|nr:hypothetical protein [Streptantibioticus silvisoli]MDI5964972.1 hypothetical protein [Streptantibioticus silvisoli]
MFRGWTRAALAVCAVVALGAADSSAHAAPADAAPVHTALRADAHGTGGADRDFSATTVTGATHTALRLVLDGGRPLSAAVRARIASLLGVPATTAGPMTQRQPSAAARGPAVLRCDKNPSWSDARGTLHARFNCHAHTVNWGYLISARVRAVITGPVTEAGVSWWRDGKRQPKNAGHVVGAGYLFHGTLKPVNHDQHVQFQDYLTFRIEIGGRTGTGSLAWAANTRTKK